MTIIQSDYLIRFERRQPISKVLAAIPRPQFSIPKQVLQTFHFTGTITTSFPTYFRRPQNNSGTSDFL